MTKHAPSELSSLASPELAIIDCLAPGAQYHQVESLLRGAGWRDAGAGDWAFALASPSGTLARISPCDPVCAFTCALYEEGAENPYLPVIYRHLDLDGGGCLQVMERLFPCEESDAVELFRLRDAREADTDLRAASDLVMAVHRRALREVPWCGELDDNPGNVMRRGNGHLVMIDPYYLAGRTLFGLIATDPAEVVRHFPAERRRHLFEIPAIKRETPGREVERLRRSIDLADQQATTIV